MLYGKMLTKLDLSRLDDETVRRIGDVLTIAVSNGEMGVVDWAQRAVEDSRMLGKLRDKDRETLVRLERNFRNDYYVRGRTARGNARLQTA